MMTTDAPLIKVNKLQAACAQLRTAIRLWFSGDDQVSAHALAFAAYEVVHTVSKKRDKYRTDLLFDSDLIKDEHRKDWNKRLKKEATFFKHADRDPDGEIEFDPDVTWGFILYAILGRTLCGAPQSDEETAFLWWFQIHFPEYLTAKGRKFVADRIPVETVQEIRRIPKSQFLDVWSEAQRLARKGGSRIEMPILHVV